MLISLSRVFLFIIPLSLLGARCFGFIGLVAGLAHLVTRNALHRA